VDILAGALSGNGCSSGQERYAERSGFFAVVIDPEHFATRATYLDLVEGLITRLKASPRAPGIEEILIPGERLARARAHSHKHGVTLSDACWQRTQKLLADLGVAVEMAAG
jgi:hydroxycarboxylate dehydrogenase B